MKWANTAVGVGAAAITVAVEGVTRMSLAERLHELRVRAGLSQYELARRTQGITPATISRIESGLIENPQRDTLVQMAEALGVAVGVLMGEEPEQPEQPLAELVRRVLQEEFPGEDIEALVQDFLLYISLPPEQRRATRQFARFLHDQEAHAEDAAADPPPRRGNRRNRGAG